LPDLVTVGALKLAVVSAGNPETLRPTVPMKPFRAVTVIFDDPLLPWVTDKEVGEADSEKSAVRGTPPTLRVKEVAWVVLPLVPVTVKG
jgi:hypothetical protein